jgi:hypothetical protein
MFERKRPCATCPFRIGMGSRFRLHPARLEEIRRASAFQCHKTVDYDTEDGEARAGERPQQCAGLMAVLLSEGSPNAIMQVAMRLGGFQPDAVDRSLAYRSWADVVAAHRNGVEPPPPAPRPSRHNRTKETSS